MVVCFSSILACYILDIGPGHQMHPLILGCEFPKVQRSRCETKNTTSERTAKNHAIPVKIVSSTPMMFHVGSLFCESIPMPVLVVYNTRFENICGTIF